MNRRKRKKGSTIGVRQIMVGHSNTIHDPAIAMIEGDCIFAEGIERHLQCKRALENTSLWYSWRAIQDALADLNLWPVKNAEVLSISTWNLDLMKRIAEVGWDRDNPTDSPVFSLMMHTLELEPLFLSHLSWIFKSCPPKFSSLPFIETPDLILDNHNISFASKMLDHSLAHAANAVFTSPFKDCIVMIFDGYGENSSAAFYHFRNNRFKLLSTQSGDSLGKLYMLITAICGFNPWEGEEWKTMGLAAYGKFNTDIYDYFDRAIVVNKLNFEINISPENLLSDLLPTIGGIRHHTDPDIMRMADLAYNFQKCFEETVLKLAMNAGNLGLSANLAYAGGCALNSSANGKILESTSFERLHIPSAPADDGNCLGAALYERHYVRNKDRDEKVMSPYLGSMIKIRELENILAFGSINYRKMPDESDLCSEVAELLADGNIVGWVQGRAEFGPRALGNRSILADPRPADMKDKINQRVKFREQFRPLAPSILHDFGNEYFENYQESPYMERTLSFRKEVRDRVPAVVHRDGTGRLQTVKEEWNPLYYRLIRAFYQKTGVPILLNTSFNVMGKPIIHSVSDAITVFYTTGMDYLVVGNYILLKDSSAH